MSGEGRGDMREESAGNGDIGSEKVRCREKRERETGGVDRDIRAERPTDRQRG